MSLLRSPLDRDIRRLAVPALGALVAEPIFLLTDTALVGHLGSAQLGGLSVASAVLQTAVGLLIFLAYSTTPAVARWLGVGNRARAVAAGVDGVWLAVVLGVILVAVGIPAAPWLISLFNPDPSIVGYATEYLTISILGLPAMLITFAASGLLRGLQDTRTPLIVAVAGFISNALLNTLFIYGFGWGVAGSAIGTVVASWGMAAAYLVMLVTLARREDARVRPHGRGMLLAGHAGAWLLLRTASLRAAMLATIAVATSIGVPELATVQITLTIFATLAFVLDALAIAGQAMIGKELGASDLVKARAITRRLVELGIGSGVVLGLVMLVVSPWAGFAFSSDPVVRSGLAALLPVLALGIPIAGFVFVLDGVLIGAGDARYLALTGLVNLAVYVPLLWWVYSSNLTGTAAIVALWFAFGLGYIGARAVTLGIRARGDQWLVPGATR
ncbi:MATE family efflux transporter [Salinibacterium sp. SWN1162]|uniref:MATE family efflux transporter n=1 Tax=Salinibacterium sp. SWN1162 TaxID=2792053 RepID=UPI0018CE30FB|nr:MATE family efflux transporter [Salinibacterium sp. SWN1162]MBH0009784.1 MATE family efflux transporter [Salinibacterium sp. SWN1162]